MNAKCKMELVVAIQLWQITTFLTRAVLCCAVSVLLSMSYSEDSELADEDNLLIPCI